MQIPGNLAREDARALDFVFLRPLPIFVDKAVLAPADARLLKIMDCLRDPSQ